MLLKQKHPTTVNVQETNKIHDNDLVNILLNQITFLKDELKSKDYIIKMLLNDRVSATPKMESTVNSSVTGTEHQTIKINGDKIKLTLADDNEIKKDETKSINVKKK